MFPELAALFLPSSADSVEAARQREIVASHAPPNRAGWIKRLCRRWCV